MKKKILLMATMIAALMCLFTVVISAAEVPEWSGITVVEGMSDKSTFGSDGTAGATSRVLMSDGCFLLNLEKIFCFFLCNKLFIFFWLILFY